MEHIGMWLVGGRCAIRTHIDHDLKVQVKCHGRTQVCVDGRQGTPGGAAFQRQITVF